MLTLSRISVRPPAGARTGISDFTLVCFFASGSLNIKVIHDERDMCIVKIYYLNEVVHISGILPSIVLTVIESIVIQPGVEIC